ncbi:MAG: two-component sensor histidine kinase [Gammaproteobacteria bacterium RIFCSPHIGHO2_12_FULL_63_22]|nr:MAG: two-component sensor histidine kinase [Gammaproteobacteria bacterium RIFCSPHIGHO2_12_FULL_63_22]
MSERSGLRRKIWVAFILQAAAISFAAVLGVYGASAVLKHVLIQRALQEEAAHFWGRREDDPAATVPDTYNMNGYLVRAGDISAVPEPLQPLPVGFHSLPRAQGGSLVMVEDRGGMRLYLLFKQEQVDSLAFWFGMAPLALVLAVVYIIAWSTYRTSKRVVSPVIWLANQVRHWDPKHPDATALKPENLPVDVEGETLTLASSLHDFASRIGSFVEREHNFTRDASHELRTPLTVIRVAGDMMEGDDSLSPMARRSLKRIQGAGRDMEALIEAFLILAREGDTGLPDEDFSVGSVACEELEKSRPLLAGKSVQLELRREADLQLHAPARVLSVMLGNLLRNACHYTEQGTVVVTVRRDSVQVSDSGVGMSPDELARVFEPFYRAGDGRKDGQGIGLSIVRRLSERYGWPVRLESEPGKGTTATISFPSAT